MTIAAFRKLALSLPGAEESAHCGHPDFRAAGRVFASLGYPDNESGMVKLTPGQQAEFIERNPAAFAPVRGAWGLRGCTTVHLPSLTATALQPAMKAAHENVNTPPKRKRKPRA